MVGGSQAMVPIIYNAYGDENDPGPFPTTPRLKGAPAPSSTEAIAFLLTQEICLM
jgi:hypothetical protein